MATAGPSKFSSRTSPPPRMTRLLSVPRSSLRRTCLCPRFAEEDVSIAKDAEKVAAVAKAAEEIAKPGVDMSISWSRR